MYHSKARDQIISTMLGSFDRKLIGMTLSASHSSVTWLNSAPSIVTTLEWLQHSFQASSGTQIQIITASIFLRTKVHKRHSI